MNYNIESKIVLVGVAGLVVQPITVEAPILSPAGGNKIVPVSPRAAPARRCCR